MPDSILLRFANEEMMYLLRSLRITSFPGLVMEPLKELPDGQKSLLMMEADHTLRARGLVRWQGETKREISPLVAGMLQECAQPRYTLFVDVLSAARAATQILYLFGQKIIVEQSEPEPQVQQYLIMPGYEDFIKRLQALITIGQEETPQVLPAGQLSPDLWKEALKVAADKTAMCKLLAKSLPVQSAEALAIAIHTHQHIYYLARWQQTPAEQPYPEMALTLVKGSRQLFLLHQEGPAESILKVIPATADKVWEHITRLVPHA